MLNFYPNDKNDCTNDLENWIQDHCKINEKNIKNQANAFDLFIYIYCIW